MPLVDVNNLEHVRCNLCQSDDYEIIGRKSRFDLPLKTAICQRCGLIYLNPRLTKAANDKFYEEAYRKLLGQKDRPLPDYFDDQRAHAQYRILEFAGDVIPTGGRALDIGCSTGGILSLFKEKKGYDLYGVEPSLMHSKFAQEHSGVTVYQDVFENLELERNFFDFVLLTQVLNHLLDPLASLRKVRSILKPGGKVYVEVMDFVQATRIFPYQDCMTVDHPYMFCVETMQAMLRYAGFEVLRIVPDRGETLDDQSRKTRRAAPWCHIRAIAQVGEPVEDFADYNDLKDQIKRNRRYQLIKSLGKKTTYRRYAGGLIKSIAGERVAKKLRRMKRR